MENRYLANLHPFVQLIIFVLIALVSFFSVMILAVLFGLVFFNIPLNNWIGLDLNDPGNLSLLKYLQITQSVGLFVIPPLMMGWLAMRNPAAWLMIDKKVKWRPALTVFILLLAILPFLNYLSILNQELDLPGFLSGIERWMQRSEDQAADLTVSFLSVNSFGGYLINILMIALLPAIGEEFFFRGVLQRTFQRWFRNPHLSILLVSVIFSAFHMQFYGFMPRLVLGLLFGYLLWWSGNLWYPVIGHFINNFLPVTLTYLFPVLFNPAELDQIGSGPGTWIWALPSAIAVFAGCYYFYRSFHLKYVQSDQ